MNDGQIGVPVVSGGVGDAAVVRMLQAYQQRLRELPAALTAATWAAHAIGLPQPSPTAWRQACDALGIEAVGLPVLLDGAHRLAVLEAGELAPVLAARALYPRRGALARCIDGAYLAGLGALLGPRASAALAARDGRQADAAGPLPRLDPAALAAAGLAALLADGWLSDPSLIRLMSLTIGAAVPTAGAADGRSAAFIAALPTLYPELSWLFG